MRSTELKFDYFFSKKKQKDIFIYVINVFSSYTMMEHFPDGPNNISAFRGFTKLDSIFKPF